MRIFLSFYNVNINCSYLIVLFRQPQTRGINAAFHRANKFSMRYQFMCVRFYVAFRILWCMWLHENPFSLFFFASSIKLVGVFVQVLIIDYGMFTMSCQWWAAKWKHKKKEKAKLRGELTRPSLPLYLEKRFNFFPFRLYSTNGKRTKKTHLLFINCAQLNNTQLTQAKHTLRIIIGIQLCACLCECVFAALYDFQPTIINLNKWIERHKTNYSDTSLWLPYFQSSKLIIYVIVENLLITGNEIKANIACFLSILCPSEKVHIWRQYTRIVSLRAVYRVSVLKKMCVQIEA